MKRLFVDCDSTLVLWKDDEIDPATSFIIRNNYDVNYPLIEAVHKFMSTHKDWLLIIWSGGGLDYATGWANRFFRDENGNQQYDLSLAKDYRIPDEKDICVDDELIKVKAWRFLPDAFINEAFVV